MQTDLGFADVQLEKEERSLCFKQNSNCIVLSKSNNKKEKRSKMEQNPAGESQNIFHFNMNEVGS